MLYAQVTVDWLCVLQLLFVTGCASFAQRDDLEIHGGSLILYMHTVSGGEEANPALADQRLQHRIANALDQVCTLVPHVADCSRDRIPIELLNAKAVFQGDIFGLVG